MTIHYFAFGSNLSSPRLQQRIPRASKHCVATLPGHDLRWHKSGHDRSGKCSMQVTGEDSDLVYGVVYRITRDDRDALDVYEGEGCGYARREVRVTASNGEVIEAFTYFATDIDQLLRPYHWYKEHVLRGALEHGFPAHYVERIRAVESIHDVDLERHRRELSIYAEPI